MLPEKFVSKRAEDGLLERMLNEACRAFMKSEAHERALALGVEDITFEYNHCLPDYKYGLDKVVYAGKFKIDPKTSKRFLEIKRMEIYCDIGFLRYFDVNKFNVVLDRKSVFDFVVINIISFNKLSDMRVAELAYLPSLKNVNILGKLENTVQITECGFIIEEMKEENLGRFRGFLEDLKNAGIDYHGDIDYYVYLGFEDLDITYPTDTLTNILKGVYKIANEYELGHVNIKIRVKNQYGKLTIDTKVNNIIYNYVTGMVFEHISDVFKDAVLNDDTSVNFILSSCSCIGEERGELKSDYLVTLSYCESFNFNVYVSSGLKKLRLESYYKEDTFGELSLDGRIQVC